VWEDRVDGGEWVAFRWSGWGSQRGEFADMTPAGRAIADSGITIARMEIGKPAQS
jgi:hypothetical protein